MKKRGAWRLPFLIEIHKLAMAIGATLLRKLPRSRQRSGITADTALRCAPVRYVVIRYNPANAAWYGRKDAKA
jgi:hypothetical protein